jgi:hypothetical protein
MLMQWFGKFLKDVCKIEGNGKSLTLYSLRHAFHDAMDTAEVPEKIQKRLVGHAKGHSWRVRR